MKKEFAYTPDNKKVTVIKKLNSTDTIVQEVFINDKNEEILAGEQFTVKTSSLHTEPIISWKEKRLKEIEERYDREQKDWQDRIDRNQKNYLNKCKLVEEKLLYLSKVLDKTDEKSFKMLIDYISGKITHVVYTHYSDIKLLTFEEFNQQYEGRLRLISIFGSDDGSLTYKIGQYYDYSGSNDTFYPCTSYEEAVEKIKELVLSSVYITEQLINTAKKYKVKLPKDKIDKYKEDNLKSEQLNINNYQKQIDNSKERMKVIKNL